MRAIEPVQLSKPYSRGTWAKLQPPSPGFGIGSSFPFERVMSIFVQRGRNLRIQSRERDSGNAARANPASSLKGKSQLFTICVPLAASPLSFRVSDAGRRRKVDGARTRGPHAVRYGDLKFGQSWAR